jgi:hypothetical protein
MLISQLLQIVKRNGNDAALVVPMLLAYCPLRNRKILPECTLSGVDGDTPTSKKHNI